jgi:transposase InsO family protein
MSARNLAADAECSYVTCRQILKAWGLNSKGRRMKDQNLHVIDPECDYAKARRSRIYTVRPGQLVHADVKLAAGLKGGRRVYLFVLVDNFSSFAWAVPMGAKTARDTAVAVQRAYSHFPFAVETLYTDNGVEFTGAAFLDIAKRLAARIKTTRAKHPWSNGKAEALNKMLKYEVMPVVLTWKVYSTHAEMEPGLDAAMLWYNCKRRHFGNNNGGRTPLQVIQDYVERLADAEDKALLASNLSTVFGADGDMRRQLLLRLPDVFGKPLLDLVPNVLCKAGNLALPKLQNLERPPAISSEARNALNAIIP